MSFGSTDDVRARTHATRAGAGWWRSVLGVAGVAIALLLGLPVAARGSEQPLGSPAGSPNDGAVQHPPETESGPQPPAARDDGTSQRPPEGHSGSEPEVVAGDDQAANTVQFGDADGRERAARGDVAAAASAPRLTRGAPGDDETRDPTAQHSDDDARVGAWQARAASSGTAAAREPRSPNNDSDDAQRTATDDHEHAGLGSQSSAPTAPSRSAPPAASASARFPAAPGGNATVGVPPDSQRPSHADYEHAAAAGHHAGDVADEEATPAAPHVEASVAVAPALRQRALELPRRAYHDARRSTPDRTDVQSSSVEHVGSTTPHTRSFSRSASAPRPTLRSAATATLPTRGSTPVTLAQRSVRTRPSKPDKQAHAHTSTRQRTAPVQPPSRHGAQTTTTGTVASGSSASVFGASPVTGGLIAWALATSAIWFVLRERAHRLRSLLWAARLERPG